jgi:glycosyltransferase involved in cell wall biosynthesis
MIAEIIIVICSVLTVCYIALMLLYRNGWTQQPIFTIPPDFKAQTTLSIIIPARDEATNIAACIESILLQDYPQELVEIIVVDDHSTDNTAAIIQRYPTVKYLNLAEHVHAYDKINAYKKKALATGIAHSNGTLILTTDADCIAPKHWLALLAARYQQDFPEMIVGPVDFSSDRSSVQLFQSIDFMSMQGITGAAHYLKLGSMSNGANLAFTRKAYISVNGYDGIDHLASGDDYLLLVKLHNAYPGKISYLKSQEAVIRTAPQPDWSSFLQQRIRWASKSGKYDDKRLTMILLLVYLYNCSFILSIIAACVFSHFWWLPVAMILAKIIFEMYYLFPVARFFHKEKQLWLFPFLQPLHIGYIILAGFLGFVGVYRWKGRTVR